MKKVLLTIILMLSLLISCSLSSISYDSNYIEMNKSLSNMNIPTPFINWKKHTSSKGRERWNINYNNKIYIVERKGDKYTLYQL